MTVDYPTVIPSTTDQPITWHSNPGDYCPPQPWNTWVYTAPVDHSKAERDRILAILGKLLAKSTGAADEVLREAIKQISEES